MFTGILHRIRSGGREGRWLPLTLLLSIPILNVFYGLLNNGHRGAASLVTDLDRLTPFVKPFIIPYMLWYPFMAGALVYICYKNRGTYYRTLAALDAGLLVCYMIYFLFQTTVPRPVLTGDDPFTRLIGVIYASDQPFNCFPSIHVLTSYLIYRAIGQAGVAGPVIRTTFRLTSAAIIASTLLVKQHVILDAVGAIVLGELLFRLAGAAPRLYTTISDGRRWQWLRRPYSLLTTKRKY